MKNKQNVKAMTVYRNKLLQKHPLNIYSNSSKYYLKAKLSRFNKQTLY